MTPHPPTISPPPTTGPIPPGSPATHPTAGPTTQIAALPLRIPATPSVPTATVFTMVGFWTIVAFGGALLARATAWRARPDGSLAGMPDRQPPHGDSLVLWSGAAVLFVVQVIFGGSVLPHLQARFVNTSLLDEVSMLGIAGMYVTGLACAGLLHWLTGGRSLAAVGITRPPGRRDLALAVTAAFVAIPATNAALTLTQWMWERLSYKHESVHQLLQLMGRDRQSPMVLILTILVAVVLAPAFEELMFRGHIQSAIERAMPWSRWLPIGITSLLFAAMHEAWMMPPIFVLSLALGYVYQRSRSLWVSMLLHMTFNGVSTAIYLVSQG